MHHIDHDHGAYSFSAAISIVSCMSVILTLVIFEKMRSKLFMRFIAFMALGDIMGCIPYLYTWEFPESSPWCWFGGILLQIGSVSAWLWTAALCFMWHRASTKTLRGITWHVMPLFHVVCWGLPIVFVLPSMALSPFENTSTFDGVCATYGTYSARLYHNIWSYLLLVACLLFMLGLYGHLVYLDREKVTRHSEVSVAHSRNVAAAKSTLVCYPILFVIFWLPKMILTTVYELASNNDDASFDKSIDVLTCWYMCHGVALTAVFFYNSPLARSLWIYRIKIKLQKWGVLKNVDGEEDRNSLGSSNRATISSYPINPNGGLHGDYDDDYADSVIDGRSTYADPADIDLRSSLSRNSGTRGLNMTSSLSSRPSVLQSSTTLAAGRKSTTVTVSQESTITKNNLDSAVSSVANPIMNHWLNENPSKDVAQSPIDDNL